MNPDLDRLQSYPFQKLNVLLDGVKPNPQCKPVSLYIGEPKHPTPQFIRQALTDNLDGLAVYPTTLGAEGLRVAIADWLKQRYGLKQISVQNEIIPVNGSREALLCLRADDRRPHTARSRGRRAQSVLSDLRRRRPAGRRRTAISAHAAGE